MKGPEATIGMLSWAILLWAMFTAKELMGDRVRLARLRRTRPSAWVVVVMSKTSLSLSSLLLALAVPEGLLAVVPFLQMFTVKAFAFTSFCLAAIVVLSFSAQGVARVFSGMGLIWQDPFSENESSSKGSHEGGGARI